MDEYYKKYKKYKKKYLQMINGGSNLKFNIFDEYKINNIKTDYNREEIGDIVTNFYKGDYLGFLNGRINDNIEMTISKLKKELGGMKYSLHREYINRVINNNFTNYKIEQDHTIGAKNESNVNDFIKKIITDFSKTTQENSDKTLVYKENVKVSDLINNYHTEKGVKGEIDGMVCIVDSDDKNKLRPIFIIETKNSYKLVLDDLEKMTNLIELLKRKSSLINDYNMDEIDNTMIVYCVGGLEENKVVDVMKSRGIVNLVNKEIIRKLFKFSGIKNYCKVDELDNYLMGMEIKTEPSISPHKLIRKIIKNINENKELKNVANQKHLQRQKIEKVESNVNPIITFNTEQLEAKIKQRIEQFNKFFSKKEHIIVECK